LIVLIGSSESFTYSKVKNNTKFYKVAEGSSLYSVIEDLALEPMPKLLLKIYLKTNSINLAQAGLYHLQNKSWREFLSSVSKGDVAIFKLQIPAGKNLFELEDIILELNLTYDCINFECLDKRFKFIEGTLTNILKVSQDQFFNLSTSIWSNRNIDLPLKSLSEAIILASIVEKEAGNDEEKAIIAGVFLHRLSIGMRLQADPTIIYGLMPDFNGDITKANLIDKNNLYNTYQIQGLPPTPISTISKSSLEAVILGMPNDYLYFVAKGDGTHKFSKTYKEHLDAVKKYQLN
jgi:UPF0755 protein